MIRIRHRMFHQWNIDIQLKLTALTLHGTSGMSDAINDYPNDLITWVAFEKSEPVGWGIQIIRDRRNTWDRKEAQFYVHPQRRREGIGRRIINRMRKDGYNQFWVSPWDRAATSFFTKVGAKEY